MNNQSSSFFLLIVILFFQFHTVQAVTQVTAPVNQIAWVPGTEKFIAINKQNKPFSWDSTLECPLYFFSSHKTDVLKVLVSKNGRLALSSDLGGHLKIWDVQTGSEIHEIVGFDQPANAVALSDDATRMVVGDWSGIVKEWALADFQEFSRFKAFDAPVHSIGLFYSKRFIAAGSSEGEIILWDMQLDKLGAKNPPRHNAAVVEIEFNSSGKSIVSASNDGRLSVWEYGKETVNFITIEDYPFTIRSMGLSPDGQYSLVGAENGMMYFIDLYAKKVVYKIQLSNSPLQMVTFRNDSEVMIADENFNIWRFEMANYKLTSVTEISSQSMTPQPMQQFQGQDWNEEKTGMNFSWVQGGCFKQGCDVVGSKGCSIDNMPAKNVCVDGYWIAKKEVTEKQWLQTIQTQNLPYSGIDIPLVNSNRDLDDEGKRKHPFLASSVSWGEAQEFVCRLNRLTSADFRLPTESEWEYACKNSKNNKNIIKSGMDIEGMQTGVSEWVLDIYDRFAYAKNKHLNPLFLEDSLYYFYTQDVQRVKRGGAWGTGRSIPECIIREYNYENSGHDFKTGLRLTIH